MNTTYQNDSTERSGEAMIGKAAASAHQAIDAAVGKAAPALDRATLAAHGAVDSAADTAIPAANWAAEKIQNLGQAQEKLVNDTRDQVTTHPFKAVAIAAGIGFLLGRLM